MKQATRQLQAPCSDAPYVPVGRLDTVWFQVAGTICNFNCRHCFISCSPKNDSFNFLTLKECATYLEEARELGVKEFYFTGGEPFANPELCDILELALRRGPATVLTNATLLREDRLDQQACSPNQPHNANDRLESRSHSISDRLDDQQACSPNQSHSANDRLESRSHSISDRLDQQACSPNQPHSANDRLESRSHSISDRLDQQACSPDPPHNANDRLENRSHSISDRLDQQACSPNQSHSANDRLENRSRSTLDRLEKMRREAAHPLEIRVSLDGFCAETNDPIRGKGTFARTIKGIRKLLQRGFEPIITITRTWEGCDEAVLAEFRRLLVEIGYPVARLKILPAIKLGAEVNRSGGYGPKARVTREMMEDYDLSRLLCSSARLVTDKGVWVCPILLDFPEARVGSSLAESIFDYPLSHAACHTCWQHGAICSNATCPEPTYGRTCPKPPRA